MRNFKALFNLDATKYPNLKDVISKIKAWNLSGDKNCLKSRAPLIRSTTRKILFIK
ncbi:MAG: hypothetical protein IPL21_14550 [Saprospirales bacterium]|nr:hypothetical protein [Saprospirales bacterium]